MLRSGLVLSIVLFLSGFLYAEEGMIVKLPEPREKGGLSLEETIKNRRSERSFSEEALTIKQISQLLWSCQGITDRSNGFRSAPSAGATYPLEIYLVSSDGIFHYAPQTHSLERLGDEDVREELSGACYGQGFVKAAAIDIVICADFRRTTDYYGERGRSYVYIEVGHAAENLHLQSVSEGLGSVPVGAFSEDSVKRVLGLPKELVPLYIVPVGHVKD